MNEFARFLNAARFLTIVPVPDAEALESDWVFRSAKYFPLVGLLVGALSAAVLLVASELWSGALPALLAVTASVAVTGAFHEDGLADTADSFGGRSSEQRLAIMKDSRIGTYGALALGLGVAIRVAALAALPPSAAAAALLAAHSGGRLTAMVVMALQTYAPESSAKVAHTGAPPRASEFLPAIFFVGIAAAPLVALAPLGLAAGIAAAVLVCACLARLARGLYGGHTGDVLGAVEQVFEIAFLAAIAGAASS